MLAPDDYLRSRGLVEPAVQLLRAVMHLDGGVPGRPQCGGQQDRIAQRGTNSGEV
jgi:hypothetical protein